MAVKGAKILSLTVMAALLFAVQLVTAGSAPTTDCTSVVMSMADCLSFVTKGSTEAKPQPSCCSGLKSVLRTNPECLCEGFKSSKSFGVDLDMKKAMGLPAACKVNAPSADKCGLSLSPAGAPAGAPGSVAAVSPATGGGIGAVSPAGAPSLSGSELAPSPSLGASASSMLGISFWFTGFVLVAAFVSSSAF